MLGSPEIPIAWRIKGKGWMGVTTVIPIIGHLAKIVKGPSRHRRCIWNIPCISLHEINPIQGGGVCGAPKKSEEYKQTGTSQEEK
jgi:hypothetical protein